MFLSPYDTLACKSHRMAPIYDKVKEAMIEGELTSANADVWMVIDSTSPVPVFHHPIIVKANHSNRDQIIIDVRSSARYDRSGNLVGGSDFEFMKIRGGLMSNAWVDGNTSDLMNAGDLSMSLFGRLLSETMARRLNLDMSTQIKVMVLTQYYYMGLFTDKLDTSEDGLIKSGKRISRVSKVPLDTVLTLIENAGPMYSISDYIDALVKSEFSIRLSKLSPGIIYTMLGGVWYGANPTETVAVALEHPPTWIAMLTAAIRDRSYRKTILAQLLLREDRRGDLSDAYNTNIKRLIKG